jgi:hypothetical protein
LRSLTVIVRELARTTWKNRLILQTYLVSTSLQGGPSRLLDRGCKSNRINASNSQGFSEPGTIQCSIPGKPIGDVSCPVSALIVQVKSCARTPLTRAALSFPTHSLCSWRSSAPGKALHRHETFNPQPGTEVPLFCWTRIVESPTQRNVCAKNSRL